MLLVDAVCGRGKVLCLLLADSTFVLETVNELDVKSESHFTCWADTGSKTAVVPSVFDNTARNSELPSQVTVSKTRSPYCYYIFNFQI